MLLRSRQIYGSWNRQAISYKGLVHPKNQKKYYESRGTRRSDFSNVTFLLLVIFIFVLCILPFLYLTDWIRIISH